MTIIKRGEPRVDSEGVWDGSNKHVFLDDTIKKVDQISPEATMPTLIFSVCQATYFLYEISHFELDFPRLQHIVNGTVTIF